LCVERPQKPTGLCGMNAQHGVLSHAIENIQSSCQRSLMLLVDNQKRIDGLERDLSVARVSLETLSRRMPTSSDEGNIRASNGGQQTQRTQSQKSSGPRYWTPAEHSRFVEALDKYGRKDVKSIAKYVETRNATQVRTHAQKYFLRMKKEDPDNYARFCEDEPDDMISTQLPQKRKADVNGPTAYTLVGNPGTQMQMAAMNMHTGMQTTMLQNPAAMKQDNGDPTAQ